MKTETSSLDLHYLIKEFDVLIGGKINKIYKNEDEFLFEFHVPTKGKIFLKLLLPKLMFLTDEKADYEEVKGFCVVLRKQLNNFRLREIRQIDFERIIEFDFEKDQKIKVIIELFSQGNIILCDENYKIINAFLFHKWKDREIKKALVYSHPRRENNLLELSKEQLKVIMQKSNKENIVKILALDLGLGGLYSEELCVLANIDKNKKEVNDAELNKLFSALEHLRNKKIDAVSYSNKELFPFTLKQFETLEYKRYSSFNKAIASNLSSDSILQSKISQKFNKELEKINRIIEEQEKTMDSFEKSIEENQKKGELVYEKYQLIDSLIKELNEIRKKHSWKEIKEKLKDHKMVKEINEKEGKIIVEL
jgi:predicted ribosome quality control (RQC) complex YloA/Tae2 family protein